jgi:Na+/citrate or Na+/malate symporter
VTDDQPVGSLRPTPVGALAVCFALGMVGGWLLHRLGERIWGAAPLVGWGQVLVLAFVAAILGVTAWLTWRQVQVRKEWLEPHRAVNRLVLAKACALVGSIAAGGYVGYALSWVGVDAELAGQRVARSLLAALAGVVLTLAAMALERACRVRNDDLTN